ncbi:hypothetical protein TIFTF001_006111 [Ficus carica]|uniref:non-specific serine/threonine protein kinase n=1 Tax=Ficus carica TaxID=3494 RepID=A0AA87ZHW4_FICCA|nr:hypothetical protein TIFTF001_006111 [Ficus carica]
MRLGTCFPVAHPGTCQTITRKEYHSLYINCGGEEEEINGSRYDQDNNSLLPYGVSQKGTNYWAFSSSGSFLSTDSNSNDSIKSAKCGLPVEDAPLYSKARLAPVSLKYYGLCLLEGNYNVKLHFAEIVYNQDDTDHQSDLKKRIFDVYIQDKMVERNFHINSTASGTEKITVINRIAHVGENGLLKIHLYWAGKGSSGDPPDFNGPLLSAISVTPDFKLGEKLSRSQIAMITLGSITVALLLLLAFSWMMGWLEKEELHDIKVGDDKTVTLKQLIAATRGFNKDMEIGKGSFGTVYRAELPDHMVVAVKKVSTLSDEGIEKLNVGIYHLQNLRHENLVRLLDIHVGKDLCFLVYEYMENKSLADALFQRKIELNWDARFNICVGIAKGLQYLHEHPRWKMVHWGIKASNILLDGKLEPKISDLGLASASVENASEANYFLSLMGSEASTGYMAPEYPAIGKKSGYKYDVYSFGVVMLEIVCGRKNVGAGLKNKHELELLVDEVCIADSKGKLPSLVDESLSGTYDMKQAMTILKLAMKCTHISPGVRPTMSQVVSVLADDKPLDEISVPAPKEDEKSIDDSSEDLAT